MTQYHVFLSHNSSDKPVVETLANQLRRHNIEPWLDKWNLIPGTPWQDEIEKALENCASCCVFIGPAGISPWQNAEMRTAIDRRINKGDFRVIPVLLPGGERDERSKLPSFLRQTTWVEFRDNLDDKESFRRLKSAILGVVPGPSPGEEISSGINPYRGLEVFNVEHAPFFYGREALIEWLLNELIFSSGHSSNRFISIVGASGCGKSSLARAGLVSALKNGTLDGSDEWPVRILKPGYDPIESLALKLASNPTEFKTLCGELAEDDEQLHLTTRFLLRDKPESHRLVLLVDQLEEIFTLCRKDSVRRAFINNLMRASTEPQGQTLVILTLRADFYGSCAEYDNLAAALADHQLLVGPMNKMEIRDAIVKPAEKVGCEFESGLIEILIRDVQGQIGGLPLLQYALTRLWEQREGKRLTLTGYKKIGELTGALDQRANEIFNEFNVEEKETCRQIFLRLIEPGEFTEDTRRRMPLSELCLNESTTHVLSKLINARLVTSESGDQKNESFYEISHEALIRSWSEFQRWIEADRESLRVQHRLNETIHEWRQNDYDEAYLYRGNRLIQTEEWAENRSSLLNDVEQKFVSACLDLRDKENRREQDQIEKEHGQERRIHRLINMALVVALILASVAGWNWWKADQQTKRALQAEKEANDKRRVAELGLAKFLASESTRLNPKDNAVLKLLLATEALNITHTTQTYHAVRQALNQHQVLLLAGHKNSLNSVTFSDDGKWVASASRDKTVRLWNRSDLDSQPKILDGHEDGVSDVAFSADGRFVASASNKTIKIWDLNRLASPPQILTGHKKRVTSLSFSFNGQWLASGSIDHTIRLWDFKNLNANPRILQGHKDSITSVAFSRDKRWLASGSQDGTVGLWDLKNLDVQPQMLRSHQRNVYSVAFSADSKRLASGGFEPRSFRVISLWDLSNISGPPEALSEKIGIHDFGYSVSTIAFSRSGKNKLVSSCTDSSIRIWNIDDPNSEPYTINYGGFVYSVALSSDGHWLASGGYDNLLRLWNTAGNISQPKKFIGQEHWVFSLAVNSDGRWLAFGDGESNVLLWDLNDPGNKPRLLVGHEKNVISLAFSPDSHWLVSSGSDSVLRLWDLENSNITSVVLQKGTSANSHLAFSRDSRWLASSVKDSVQLWDMSTLDNPPKLLTGHDASIITVAFPSTDRVASVTSNNIMRMWNMQDLNRKPEVYKLNGNQSTSAAFSSDGQRLALAELDKDNSISNLHNLDAKPILLKGNTSIKTFSALGFPVAISQDGQWVALGGGDKIVRLWNLDSLDKSPILLHGHSFGVQSVVFDPHGRWLATGGFDFDASMKIWALPDDLLKKACQRSGRNLSLAQWRHYLGDKPYQRTCLQWTLPNDIIAEAVKLLSNEKQSASIPINFLVKRLKFEGADENKLRQEAHLILKRYLIEKSIQLSSSNINEAVRFFSAAFRYDPNLRPDDLPSSAVSWNELCWKGSLNNQAREVMIACEAAVEKASDNLGFYRDSRGLARALTGDYKGAVDDLTAFIAWALDNNKRKELIMRRREWLEVLKTGGNPYDEATLNLLRKE